MKQIIFTRHAEEKLAQRNISKKLVISTLKESEEIISGKDNTKIAHKYIKGKLLRVIFREQELKYIIITCYYTEKKRYEVTK